MSDNVLVPVNQWRSSCEEVGLRYQAARVTVMSEFSDGEGNGFTADITSLVLEMVRTIYNLLLIHYYIDLVYS